MRNYLTFFMLSSSVSLLALPVGGQVMKGDAAIVPSSEGVHVHANGKSIIHWDQFDIASHEKVSFLQSQTKEAVLNRVVKGSSSQIYGLLESNCPIYLINPQGVFIGSGAQINTAGFLASTADISNEAFWQGSELRFESLGEGKIVNLGSIDSPQGDIVFIARSIDNRGQMMAPEGVVTFATSEVMIHPQTKRAVFIRLGKEEGEINNSGTIRALAVEFKTQSPYEKAIHHTGSIEAFTTQEQNGRVYLVADRGGTVINGDVIAPSGDVRILGESVRLQDRALIDVSGPQGGTILVGGDYQGKNCEILNAKTTFVAKEATLLADGVEGNAGRVIIWGEEIADYHGTISCQALGERGDGGFVEISAKSNHLVFEGPVNTLAVNGKTGMLLLDPVDITINNFGGTSSPTFPTTPPGTYAPTTVASANLDIANLQTALATTNVTIDSTTGTGGPTTGNINFVLGPTWSAKTTLFANAARSIGVGGTISATGGGAVNFTAQGLGGTTTGHGIGITGSIQTNSGNITLNGTGFTFDFNGLENSCGVFVDTTGLVTTNSGTITMIGQGGNLGSGNDGILIRGLVQSVVSGDINIQGVGGIPINTTYSAGNGVIARIASVIRSSGTGNINMNGTAVAFGQNATGVEFGGDGQLVTCQALGSGNISINGLVLGGATPASQGVQCGNQSLISTQSGTITIVGENRSTTGGNNSNGVFIILGTVQSNSGDISITASKTSSTADFGAALALLNGTVQSTSGKITAVGTNLSSLSNTQFGIQLVMGTIKTGDGNVQLTGQAGGAASGNTNNGIFLGTSSSIQSTGRGTLTLTGTGGPGTSTTQGILVTGAGTFISSTQSNMSLTGTGGGAGTSADGIAVLAGGKITTANNGAITLQGMGSTVGVTGHNGVIVSGTSSAITAAAGNINLTATGGAAGAAGAGLTVSAAGAISTTNGVINVLNATGSPTGTTGCHGIFITGTNSKITTASGALNLNGTGQGSGATNQGIRLESNGSLTSTGVAPITLTGVGSSLSEGIFITGTTTTISSVSGGVQMTATAGGGTINGITVDSSASIVTTTSGGITTHSPHRLLVQNNGSIRTLGGGAPNLNSIALTTGGVSLIIGATGGAQISTVSGNITATSTGSVLLTAGAVVNAAAQIATGQGNIFVSTPNNIILTGGGVGGATALIRSTTQGALTLNANNLTLQGGSATAQAGVITQSGDIRVTCVQNCQTSAPTVTAPAIIRTFGSDLVVIAGGSINLTGFTTLSTPAPSGNLLLMAGQNISIGSTTQVIANGTVSSSLKLIVDNNFPTAPGIGPGQFILAAGGIVSAGTGAPVRIYTARRSQNTVSAPINGAAFIPGPFDVNSSTEQWSTYYPAGTYGGAVFKIYYKEPTVIVPVVVNPTFSIPSAVFTDIAANLVELADLSPVLKALRLPRHRFPAYHFQICDGLYCAPTFSPYGSFIFEDDLYWIGVEF